MDGKMDNGELRGECRMKCKEPSNGKRTDDFCKDEGEGRDKEEGERRKKDGGSVMDGD